MKKKTPDRFNIRPLPDGLSPVYNVEGSPTDQQTIREWVNAAAPNVYPNQITLVPGHQYSAMTNELEHGRFMGQPIASSSGRNGQENFGMRPGSGVQNTRVGDGFSIQGQGKIYLNSDILKHPNHGQEILAHELGHYSAPDDSETQADEYRDAYLKRMRDTTHMWDQTSRLSLAPGIGLNGLLAQPGQSPAVSAGLNGIRPVQGQK